MMVPQKHHSGNGVCWSLVAGDVLAFCASFGLGLLLLAVVRMPQLDMKFFTWWREEGALQAILFAFVTGLSMLRMVGQRHYSQRQPFWDELWAILKVIGLAAVMYGFAAVVAKWPVSRFLWPSSWLLAAVLVPVGRMLVRTILDHFGLWKRPTVVIGATDRARDVVRALESDPVLGFQVVALVEFSDALSQPSGDVRVRILPQERLLPWLQDQGFPNVVIALDPSGHDPQGDWLEQLALYPSGIHVVPSMSGLPLLGVGASLIFRYDVLLLQIRNRLEGGPSAFLKRLFDFSASLIGLILLSPILLWIAVLIRRQGGQGSVFFAHERVGRHGRPFKCWKFRTMVKDSQDVLQELLNRDPAALNEWERDFKLKNDPRITSIGAFLRRTSLDELPQLWNVLRGEMSLVGPRPVIAQELERYGNRKAFYCSVRPGITGLWQVSGRNDLSYPERVALDAWYVKNWRFWYDIVILAKTVRAVLRLDGAY